MFLLVRNPSQAEVVASPFAVEIKTRFEFSSELLRCQILLKDLFQETSVDKESSNGLRYCGSGL